MKKLICAGLAILLCFAMSACAGNSDTAVSAEEGSGTFRVGYSRVIITPEEPVPLGGFGTSSTRISQNVLDDIYVTCIALTDADDNTVLLVPIDWQRIQDEVIDKMQEAMANATGLDADRIIITASHTHSVADLYSSAAEIARYKELLYARCGEAAKEAMADRTEASFFTGTADCTGLNFYKHYYNVDDDGNKQYFGDNFGDQVLDETTSHVDDVYHAMHLLQIKREGKKDIVISNFRSHPTLTGGTQKYDISSDFIGPLRDYMEKTCNCDFAFIQGACGNINPFSRIMQENLIEKDYVKYGYQLGLRAVEGLKNMTEVPTGEIQFKKIIYTGTVNHTEDYKAGYARLVQQMWSSTGYDADAVNAFGRPHGINSVYHAGAILNRLNMGETQEMEVDVLSIGDQIGFFSAPGELWDTVSVLMEEKSPFPLTVTVGFTNGDWKYFPYQHGDYISYESGYAIFELDTAEKLMDVWTPVLQEFYDNAHGTQEAAK